jgi:hypothetical protein
LTRTTTNVTLTPQGDIRETCGGNNRLSLFFLPTNATTGTGDSFIVADGQLLRN